jgi:signal transduction histidine kinase
VTVRDSGPGIAPHVLPKLFQRFAPGPNSSGLGLGLYIASRITAAHDGTLTVDSIPGQGATFRLALPLADGVECDA